MAPPTSSSSSTQPLGFSQLSPLLKVVVVLPMAILFLEHFSNTALLLSNSQALVSSHHDETMLNIPPELYMMQKQKQRDTLPLAPPPRMSHSNNNNNNNNSKNDDGFIYRDPKRGIKRPLSQVVGPVPEDCGPNGTSLVPMPDFLVEDEESLYRGRRIPKLVHQTSKLRCVTREMFGVLKSTWRRNFGQNGYAYYFHSDEAMERLILGQDWPEFPHLQLVWQHCIPPSSGTIKADLWRYVVLWEYGGIYADMDTKPSRFGPDTIQPHDEGFFVVEQYHLLSQYFMAVRPKHPIMYYAIQSSLLNLLQENDIGSIRAPQATGPHALHEGFRHFMRDQGQNLPKFGVGVKAAKAGLWVGTDNATIRVEGVGEKENEYVRREFVPRGKKVQEYNKMGMEHFTSHKLNNQHSCLRTLWNMQTTHFQQQ